MNQVKTINENIEELNQKIKVLETEKETSGKAPEIIEKIKDIMLHKGFLSEKEFDDIMQ